MKDELLASLNRHASELTALHAAVKAVKTKQVSKASIKTAAKGISRRWFDDIKSLLERANFSDKQLSLFSAQFEKLLDFSRTRATKKSYIGLLTEIINSYTRQIIHEVEIGSFSSRNALSISPYIEGLSADEGAYLEEAQKCLSVGALRACIVLGWCATVSRIHEKIAAVGFSVFNRATEEMAGKQYGRFKPFNKKFRVESTSELRRTVFDTDLLWVLEYMGLIDSNQHERLRHCFELRNNSAHPGQAPITGENLYSFYSDITKIVLKNPKFSVPQI